VSVALPRRRYGALYAGNSRAVIARGLIATRSNNWIVIASGFFEPIFYLLSLGIGFGSFVGGVQTASGQTVPYAAYIAPALLATAAMNGAIYDSTWNVFFKMNYSKLYQSMLATSLGPLDIAFGEILLALARGGVYAAGFLIVMTALGLALSWTAILALPAVLLIAFGFASIGMGITSLLKTFQQMDLITLAMLPMFLFSATFYPISVYPEWIRTIIELLPLWHGVELVRGLTTGALEPGMWLHLGYFVLLIAFGIVLTTRRLRILFLA
jgi:lipooligosaccharide transport system permease protein